MVRHVTCLAYLGEYDVVAVYAGIIVQSGAEVVHGRGRRYLHADSHLSWLLVHIHHLKFQNTQH